MTQSFCNIVIAQSGVAAPDIFEIENVAEHTDWQWRVNLSDQRLWETSLQTTKHQPAQHWHEATTASHQRIRPTSIHKKTFGDEMAESSHYQNEANTKSNKTLPPRNVWICLLEHCQSLGRTSAQPFHLPEFTSINRIVRHGSPDPDRITTRRTRGLWRRIWKCRLDRICWVKFLLRRLNARKGWISARLRSQTCVAASMGRETG